jgi:hypothetical protein
MEHESQIKSDGGLRYGASELGDFVIEMNSCLLLHIHMMSACLIRFSYVVMVWTVIALSL